MGGRERRSGVLLGAVIAAGVTSLLCPGPLRAAGPGAPRVPVLVELFTSEGCSSCPPADRLLGKLDREQPVPGAEVVVLGEHVDYWDQLGWHDRFSSPLYTARQQQYARWFGLQGPYTPQMVVDGRRELVGSDEAAARNAIAEAARRPKKPLSLAAPTVEGTEVSGTVTMRYDPHAGGAEEETVFAALVDPTDVTQVGGGENGGRRLTHAGVVRTLRQLDPPEDGQREMWSFALLAPAQADLGRMRLVVFAVGRNGEVTRAAMRAVQPQPAGVGARQP